MKSSELHRLILKNGWRSIRQAGSHVIYEKDGKTVSVPFHGSKEMGSGIARRLLPDNGGAEYPRATGNEINTHDLWKR